ncbi:MAG: hypothetical protein ACI8P3_000855 [Saprospiraceae bacterium]|jgi:hypothetical protein
MKKTFQIILLLVFAVLVGGSLQAAVSYSVPLKGQEHQIGSLLNWSTSSELNSQVFIVEKSVDGLDYQAIGEIEAIGNTTDENGYRFLDVGVNDIKSFYRLKQVDYDGTASFSQTIMLQKKLTKNYMILAMSNTVTNSTFTLSIDSSIDEEIYYIVKTKKGEIVQGFTQMLSFGINEITINVADEVEGTYLVVLNVKNEREQIVIHKVDDEIKKKENVASKKQLNGG